MTFHLNLKADIAKELFRALDDLCADPQLLKIVDAYGDTLTDEEVLAYLKEFNGTGSMFARMICSGDPAPPPSNL